MRKNKDNKIYSFDINIYGRKVYIVKIEEGGDYSILKKNFHCVERDKIINANNLDDNSAVTWDNMANNISHRIGELIMIRPNSTVNTITHESTHAAMDILANVGVKLDADNQEPIAYLAGYIAECIEKVLKDS